MSSKIDSSITTCVAYDEMSLPPNAEPKDESVVRAATVLGGHLSLHGKGHETDPGDSENMENAMAPYVGIVEKDGKTAILGGRASGAMVMGKDSNVVSLIVHKVIE